MYTMYLYPYTACQYIRNVDLINKIARPYIITLTLYSSCQDTFLFLHDYFQQLVPAAAPSEEGKTFSWGFVNDNFYSCF